MARREVPARLLSTGYWQQYRSGTSRLHFGEVLGFPDDPRCRLWALDHTRLAQFGFSCATIAEQEQSMLELLVFAGFDGADIEEVSHYVTRKLIFFTSSFIVATVVLKVEVPW